MSQYLDQLPAELLQKASAIRLLTLDVDGVLTDGSLFFAGEGELLKPFCTLDGLGIKQLKQAGLEVAIITGRQSEIVSRRAENLGIEHVYQHCEEKWRATRELQAKLNLEPENIAHMGDDLPDLSAMVIGGLSITVPNAHPLMIAHADYCTTRSGGKGAVREACDLILQARGLLEAEFERHLRVHE